VEVMKFYSVAIYGVPHQNFPTKEGERFLNCPGECVHVAVLLRNLHYSYVTPWRFVTAGMVDSSRCSRQLPQQSTPEMSINFLHP
jgi:hypothetical protein